MNYGKVAVLIVNWLHWWEELKPHQWLAAIYRDECNTYCDGLFLHRQSFGSEANMRRPHEEQEHESLAKLRYIS